MVSPFKALLPLPYTKALKPVMALPTMSVCMELGAFRGAEARGDLVKVAIWRWQKPWLLVVVRFARHKTSSGKKDLPCA